ncbi:unnamed protein product [Kluyveromyces dobzhanskii CBS 2104]|uniref:WGS project CCBQ000000000 data, contig 00006 n=1 Tax=Kluyveromyces dobzhanskii CBS 2104 TaxID=1427455 RepID=A0A0A8LA60_9SACH|nr:unnamed protein product [Kluyveromyces dobzhanskii CBS 2104]
MSHNVEITSDLINTQIFVKPGTTWDQFGQRLNELTGVDVKDMKLVLDGDAQRSRYLKELRDEKVENVHSVAVLDTNENSLANQLRNDMIRNDNDVSFEYTKEDYENRSDSVLQWKKRNQLGKFNPEYRSKMEEQLQLNIDRATELQNQIGQRCRVVSSEESSDSPATPERRGWLRYVGKVLEINDAGVWCGIEFDEPVGKNNGTFQGTKYFGPVNENYGGFVKPVTVEVGTQFTPLIDDELMLTDDEL